VAGRGLPNHEKIVQSVSSPKMREVE